MNYTKARTTCERGHITASASTRPCNPPVTLAIPAEPKTFLHLKSEKFVNPVNAEFSSQILQKLKTLFSDIDYLSHRRDSP